MLLTKLKSKESTLLKDHDLLGLSELYHSQSRKSESQAAQKRISMQQCSNVEMLMQISISTNTSLTEKN